MQLQTRSPGLKNQQVKVNGNYYEVDKHLCVEVDEDENPDDYAKLLEIGFSEDVNVPGKPTEKRKVAREKAADRTKVPSSLSSAKSFVEFVARDQKVQEHCAKCETFSELHEYAQGLGYGFTKKQLEQAREAYIARVAPVKPGAPTPPNPKKLLEQELAEQEAAQIDAVTGDEPPADPDADDEVSSPKGRYSKKLLASIAKVTGLEADAILSKAFEVDQAGDQNGYYKEEELQAAAESLLEDSEADTQDGEPVELTAELPDGTPAAEWPDPDDSMKMDYLRKMADAYEVDHDGVRKKADLIELIQGAMYGD